MLTTENVETARRERLLQGTDNWWFLGPGGVAKVLPRHLDPAGGLSQSAEQNLRAAGLYDVPRYRAYGLTVLTSTDCNLGCAYCFQNIAQDATGGNRPPRISHSRLTSESIGKVLDFAGRKMAAAGLEYLSIMLFGGEPLLNFKGCRELLTRAADYGLSSAQMISNGVLLTPLVARELGARGLRSVQISFDGGRADHDQIRVRRSGGGTFDAILENVARAMEVSDLRWELRVNVSQHVHTGIPDLIEELGARLDPARCSLYFSRIGDVGVGYANTLAHTDDLAAEFVGWNRRALELGFSLPRPGPVAACQACSYKDGRYGAVVNPNGVLYSCWETSGRPGWELGDTTSGYLPPEATEGRWQTCQGQYQYDEAQLRRQRFQDAVDAALLDDLSLAGRL